MIDKEIMDALCFLHSLAKKDKEFETQTESFKQIVAYIEDLETKVNNKWIPCEERLPSDRDWYLAVFKEADTDYQLIPMIADYIGTVTNGTTEEGWCIAHCTDTGYPSEEYYKKLKCVAWQPLPQPYKKEGAE